ncbi:S1C family serine protease [Clostridium sp.]|uniref:S1C family serine protease n=1 Tax=Clostridium sp. TaxID=1506 RepID=UPI002603DD5A|nr:S1C family serine protease [Clostridium sp.]
MHKDFKDKIKDREEYIDENFPSIQFKIRRIKRNFRFCIKISSIFLLAIISGTLFSKYALRLKYQDSFNNFQDGVSFQSKEGTNTLEYSKIITKVKDSIVTIGESENNVSQNDYFINNSTGIIIDEYGKILTTYSNIKDIKSIYVKLPIKESKPIKAELIASDEKIDIAILKVESNYELKPVKLSNSIESIEGENVVLISNCVGDDYIDSIIPGIITSTNRKLNISGNKYNLLEVNIPINEMNTGGALLNINGELIGIASYKVSQEKNQQGLNYAINLNSLNKIISTSSEIKRILGVLEGGFINYDDNSESVGLYIERVEGYYDEGLRPTDILFEVNNSKVNSMDELYGILKSEKGKDNISCKVMRNGKIKELEIKLNK